MSTQIEATRIGLIAIKSLLSRDPCVHANVAIEMIDAMLAEQPAVQQEPVPSIIQMLGHCPECGAKAHHFTKGNT